MKFLNFSLILIWVFILPLYSFPLDVRPQPPVSDPVLPTEKDPIIPSSSLGHAHSPGKGNSPMLCCSLSFLLQFSGTDILPFLVDS